MTDLAKEPRRWQGDGWTALVIKNEEDEGWAVAMTKDGASEPALVGPWTMGRDKKNPKPLDSFAFSTLVKTATEFVGRQEQQLHARLHKTIAISVGTARIIVSLDVSPDEDHPSASLSAVDASGAALARVAVDPGFVLDRASAQRWAEGDYAPPRSRAQSD
jgi:hypothetical protein